MTKNGGICDYEYGTPYNTENIEVPMAIFHGEKDELSDADALHSLLQQSSKVKLRHFEKIPEYEHMDLIWADDCHHSVFEKLDQLISQELLK